MIEIVKYPNNILTMPIDLFNFNTPPEAPSDISLELMKAMNETLGIGISANQIGKLYRVFCMRGYPDNFVCFNPKIVYYSKEQELLEEACLSLPGVNIKIKRSKEIRVRFQTPSSEIITKTFSGLTARTFQHELDHLDGILFINRANRYHRDQAMKGYYK